MDGDHTYTVVQGDTLSGIAKQHGFSRWQTIYEHTLNEDFRAKRPNPNLIYPGDIIHIPTKDDKQIAIPTGTKHRIRLTSPETTLRLDLREHGGNFLEGWSYELKVGSTSFTGTISGTIEHFIMADATDATFKATDPDTNRELVWKLKIGHLDPARTISGVQARLQNLGYYVEVTGKDDAQTMAAIRAFQHHHQLEASGIVDQVTEDKLVELYGC